MINHVRTLLLNFPGERQPRLDIIYDAYTPEYAPVELPTELQYVRTTLFGSAPDYQGMCMRTAQLLTLVAGTPYAGHITRSDPRITYDFASQAAHRLPELFASAEDADGAAVPITVTGAYSPPSGSGRSVATWAITWNDGVGTVVSTDSRETTVSASRTLRLPGSDLVAAVPAAPVSGLWRISHRSMVDGLVPAVETLLDSSYGMSALFPPGMPEPLATYYALTNHAMFPYRVAGVTLALAYQTERHAV